MEIPDFKNQLRGLRSRLGLSQEEFAKKLGVSKSKIQNIENGKQRTDHELLQVIAVNFTIDLNELLLGSQAPVTTSATTSLNDTEHLRMAIEAIEEGLDAVGRSASPDVKAALITAAYELFEQEGAKATAQIIRLVKSACLTMKDDDPKSKIINLFQETSAKDKRGQEPAINVTISGDGNVVNFGSRSKINSAPSASRRPKVVVRPGEVHISSKEAATLKSLVSKIYETEQKLKKRPSTHAKIWGQLNRHCKVSSYREISSPDFEKARSYLNKWLGRLNSMRSAPVKNGDDWRKRHYAYIKVNTKHPEDQAALEKYLKRKFKTTSLRELANDELEQAYRYVASRKQRQN